jgi:hypothetical protein
MMEYIKKGSPRTMSQVPSQTQKRMSRLDNSLNCESQIFKRLKLLPKLHIPTDRNSVECYRLIVESYDKLIDYHNKILSSYKTSKGEFTLAKEDALNILLSTLKRIAGYKTTNWNTYVHLRKRIENLNIDAMELHLKWYMDEILLMSDMYMSYIKVIQAKLHPFGLQSLILNYNKKTTVIMEREIDLGYNNIKEEIKKIINELNTL